MDIGSAVKKAVREDKCISIPDFRGHIKIKPTNDIGNCICMQADGSNPSRYGWQPSAEDLMRDDWEVVD